MSAKRTFMPAFPPSLSHSPMGDLDHEHGMELRDYFAGQALMGFCSGFNGGRGDVDWFRQIGAPAAYKVAEAMIEARTAVMGDG